MNKFVAVFLLVLGLLVLPGAPGRAASPGIRHHGAAHRHPGVRSHRVGRHRVGHHRFHHGFRRGVRSRVFIGVGPYWWGPPYGWGPVYGWGPAYPLGPYPFPYWWYPPSVYANSSVVVQEPPMYVQQGKEPSSTRPVAGYWYYCATAGRYYPEVEKCPEPWIKVPPTPR